MIRTGGGKLDEAYRASVFDPFTARTGIEVVSTAGAPAQLKAMVESGNVEWDLMQGSAELLVVYGREGLLEPLDLSMIATDRMAAGTMHDTFVLTDFAAYHVGWNTDNIRGEGPQSWADLFAIDGRIGLWKRPFQTLEAALLADGVPLGALYPLDADRGFAALDRVRDKVILWDSGAQGAQLLIDGEVEASAIWNGRVQEPRANGAPVDFHFNQAILVSDAWGIPRGTPNRDAAMALLAFSLTAEAQAKFSTLIPYGPVNLDALALLDDAQKAILPALTDRTVMLSLDFWAEHGPALGERFNSWQLG
ncbi:MAG: ABC transporter substrate-binding protein [Gemmobacter sp.]